ncbi:MAG: hypothetical protein U5J97_11570 [Trueperaceae bacterium]|nr:hypothetical protein [Trueperaceae bacterium]
MPIQKSGTETPTWLTIDAARSRLPPGLSAEKIPSGRAIIRPITSARPARARVAGRRRAISSEIEVRVIRLSPKSPRRTMSPTQVDVLHHQRPVEPHLALEGGDVLVGGLDAQADTGRAAGNERLDRERDDGDAEQDQRQRPESLKKIAEAHS